MEEPNNSACAASREELPQDMDPSYSEERLIGSSPELLDTYSNCTESDSFEALSLSATHESSPSIVEYVEDSTMGDPPVDWASDSVLSEFASDFASDLRSDSAGGSVNDEALTSAHLSEALDDSHSDSEAVGAPDLAESSPQYLRGTSPITSHAMPGDNSLTVSAAPSVTALAEQPAADHSPVPSEYKVLADTPQLETLSIEDRTVHAESPTKNDEPSQASSEPISNEPSQASSEAVGEPNVLVDTPQLETLSIEDRTVRSISPTKNDEPSQSNSEPISDEPSQANSEPVGEPNVEAAAEACAESVPEQSDALQSSVTPGSAVPSSPSGPGCNGSNTEAHNPSGSSSAANSVESQIYQLAAQRCPPEGPNDDWREPLMNMMSHLSDLLKDSPARAGVPETSGTLGISDAGANVDYQRVVTIMRSFIDRYSKSDSSQSSASQNEETVKTVTESAACIGDVNKSSDSIVLVSQPPPELTFETFKESVSFGDIRKMLRTFWRRHESHPEDDPESVLRYFCTAEAGGLNERLLYSLKTKRWRRRRETFSAFVRRVLEQYVDRVDSKKRQKFLSKIAPALVVLGLKNQWHGYSYRFHLKNLDNAPDTFTRSSLISWFHDEQVRQFPWRGY